MFVYLLNNCGAENARQIQHGKRYFVVLKDRNYCMSWPLILREFRRLIE